MKEIWKTTEKWPDYKVSTFGRVKSFKKTNPIILKQRIGSHGYFTVAPCKKRKVQKPIAVHRLVAEAFVLNPENKPQVNHIDGNKLNNHISNLEWVTCSENKKHAFRTGLNKGHSNMKGEINGNAKLNKFQVQRMRLLKEINPKITYKELGKLFNISLYGAFNIIKRRSWKHIA